MAKYVCSICGYVYDEEKGDPENGINRGTTWEEVSRDWTCPLCGATKDAFEKEKVNEKVYINVTPKPNHEESEELQELSFGGLSALCSNLSKGCEKQYLEEEAGLFNELATYYKSKIKKEEDSSMTALVTSVTKDLEDSFTIGKEVASSEKDRGALRAFVWSEKVTKILNSLLNRYQKEGSSAFGSSNVFVCEICGFVYIGEEPPEICPVCKVPKSKIMKIQRG